MTVRTDPEGNETTTLFALVELGGAEVLEIGCGDGRLTWRYADGAAHVTAVDPFADGIARAKERLKGTSLPIDFREVAFLDFAADARPDVFDVAILSWSLCWMPSGGMVHALEEIHRLLRPAARLIEIHPVHGAWIEVRHGDDVLFVEPDPGFDSDDELRPTENAVRAVLDRGLFTLDVAREFDFLTFASSTRELRAYFALVGGYDESPINPTIGRLRDELYERAQEALDRTGSDAQIVYREQAKMSRLDPVRWPGTIDGV